MTANSPVKLDSTGNSVINTTTADTAILGIADKTVSSGSYVLVHLLDEFPCTFDGTTVVGDLATLSTGTAGQCADSGTSSSGSLASTKAKVGIIQQAVGTGQTAKVQLFAPAQQGTQSSSGGISGLTANYIPLAGSATTLTANSHFDDGVTTASTITSSEPVAGPSFSGTSTTVNGAFTAYYKGTAATFPGTNGFQISPATSVTTPWRLSPAAAPATGVFYGANSSGTVQQSFLPLQGTDSSVLTSGTISGTGSTLCTDSSGGATTSGCSGSGVANTTLSLAAGSYTANACNSSGSAATITMTGLTTGMTITISPSSDISGSLGWSPAASGQLYFIAWPTANTVNYYVCNPTSATISTSATTWNVSAK